MKSDNRIVPSPLNDELEAAIREAAEATDLAKSDVMRHGLRLGVPLVVAQFKTKRNRRRPACLDYLDDFATAPVTARDAKAYLRKKLHAAHS